MQLIKLHCANNSRFRLGSGSLQEADDIVHSDTFFNAWLNAYVLLYGSQSVSDVLHVFQTGDCRISSAFHFVDVYRQEACQSTLYFVPKPLLRRLPDEGKEATDGSIKKRIKKLKYLSLDLLHALLANVSVDAEGEVRFSTDLLERTIFADEYAIHETDIPVELLEHWTEIKKLQFRYFIDSPKVVMNRLSAKSDDVFYQTDCLLNWQRCGDWEFRPGFYFLMKPPDDIQYANRLSAALNLMADEGLGGERSSGGGFFEQVEQANFCWELTGAYAMLLSLVLPGATDNLEQIINYQAIVRGGYVGTTGIRKKQTRMVSEGSIIKLPFEGSVIVDSPTASPASYRYGKAVYLQFGDGLL